MAIRIEILAAARSIGWTDKETGEQRSFQVQEAALHVQGQKYPRPFELAVPRNGKPYAPGLYELTDDSIYVNRQGRLTLSPKLKPAMSAAKAAGG